MPNLRKNQKGQGLVEYILIVFVMGILALTVIKNLGSTTRSGFTKAQTEMTKAFNGN
jgi:Flp pilus assembly pilin Flp